MTTIPFIYKYQPKKLKDFEINPDLKSIINILLKINNINILFIGDSGSGKTTLIDAVLHEYYNDESLINKTNVLYINNLKEQGIQYYRNDVKTFCQTNGETKKTIILDDIDLINEQSQQVFRNCIDKYGKNVNFLCSCTNTQKVIDSLQSRINCIKIHSLTEQNLTRILKHIATKESISIDDDAVIFIVKICHNSVRILINYLEKFKLLNQHITMDLCLQICTNICFSEFDEYTKLCLNGELVSAIKIINKINNKGFSVMDILDNYFAYIKYTDLLTEDFKYQLTKIIMKYISIFHNIHESEIELVLFTNNVIELLTSNTNI
tara:strand:+ start:895 stop:1860 length:966 start_codon:yes stop_codon:yes gene_type:complete